MAFEVGGGAKKIRPTMNVTPLVDVVLVLLIIFMVITPLLAKQFWTNVPVKDDPKQPPPQSDGPAPVVLAVRASGAVEINREAVSDAELAGRVRRVMAGRDAPVLFFTADDGVPYGRAMDVMDRARGSGAATIAVMTEKPEP